MSDDKKLTPPYGGFSTLVSAIQQLAQLTPHRIDRSVFPGFAGGVQTRLLNGMRFLGLIDESGAPTDRLHAVAVKDEAERKRQMATLIRHAFAPIIARDLTKVTPHQLDEAMTELYDITGDTRLKAVRFFLSAAAYAGIPMSPLLTRARQQPASNGTRRKRVVVRQPVRSDATPHPTTPITGGTEKTITLQSGGTLTLSATIDLFRLNATDRAFVFSLIDKLDEYEGQKKP